MYLHFHVYSVWVHECFLNVFISTTYVEVGVCYVWASLMFSIDGKEKTLSLPVLGIALAIIHKFSWSKYLKFLEAELFIISKIQLNFCMMKLPENFARVVLDTENSHSNFQAERRLTFAGIRVECDKIS